MATTGILFRRNTKLNLLAAPPLAGEIVYATDTFEHGVLDQDGTTVHWQKLFNITAADIDPITDRNYVTDAQLVVIGYLSATQAIDLDALLASVSNISSGTTAIAYDNTTSGLVATTVQGAIDEVEGRVDTAETKLSGIEDGATADQTGAEIKALYEAEADTNAFTDAEKTKLAGLESSHYKGTFVDLATLQATVTTPVAGDYADVDAGIGSEVTRYIYDVNDATWYAQAGDSSALTAAQVKTLYESNADTNAFTDAEKTKLASVENTDNHTDGVTNGVYTLAERAKLAAIEEGATADQTGAEIKALYEAEADTNAFTDAALAKLNRADTDSALTSGLNVAIDLSVSETFNLTADQNFTLDFPTNVVAGQSGFITITQDVTGSRLMTLGTGYVTAGGLGITLSIAPNAVDVLEYKAISATTIVLSLIADVK